MPRFSIIIPVYNTEKYIEQCILSVVNQSFQDWELVLVDDGSTDKSFEIIDRYSKEHKNIIVLHKENEGVAIARKTGKELASGDYLLFIDSDDWIDALCLEKINCIVQKYNPDAIKFGLLKHLKDGSVIDNPVAYTGLFDIQEIKKRIYPELIQDNKAHCFGTSLCGGAYKKSIVGNSLISNKNALFGEDYASYVPIIFNANTIFFLEESYYHYRYNESSATKSKKVFSFKNPYIVAEHIKRHIPMSVMDFETQLYRKIVHDVFTVCISQFNRTDNKSKIFEDIEDALNNEYYKEAISKSDFLFPGKAWLMHQSLKHHLMILLLLFSRIK